jgi:hypothetical protein
VCYGKRGMVRFIAKCLCSASTASNTGFEAGIEKESGPEDAFLKPGFNFDLTNWKESEVY